MSTQCVDNFILDLPSHYYKYIIMKRHVIGMRKKPKNRKDKTMTVLEAVQKYVAETADLTFYTQEPDKGLGIIVKGENSYMEMLMNLTQYFEANGADDVNMELEGMYVECQGDDVIVFFPNIEA